jgi:phosphinothricin acetyltransferase
LTGGGTTRIRPGHVDDLGAIVEIINHYVVHTPITFDLEPFTVASRRPWFAQFATSGRHRLWVADEDGCVVGFAATLRYRAKAAYDTTVETSVYIDPDATGRGLGARLYATLFEAIEGEDVHRALAGITMPNPASVALHRRFGFESTGVLREVGRKFGRYWDVEWFERPLRGRD